MARVIQVAVCGVQSVDVTVLSLYKTAFFVVMVLMLIILVYYVHIIFGCMKLLKSFTHSCAYMNPCEKYKVRQTLHQSTKELIYIIKCRPSENQLGTLLRYMEQHNLSARGQITMLKDMGHDKYKKNVDRLDKDT